MPLNRPLFTLAVLASALVVVVELAMPSLVAGAAGPIQSGTGLLDGVPAQATTGLVGDTPPGAGIRHLALVDGLVCFALVVIWSGAGAGQRVYSRVHGVVTIILSFFWVLGAIVAALAAFVQLLVMIALLVAAPFGTIVYFARWGFFPVGPAAAMLGLLLLLKLVMLALLVVSQPKFLTVKGLMILIGLSFVLQLVLGILHGWFPRVVVSIVDQLWALVTCIVAFIWALVMLIGAIPAVVRAARVSVARRQ